MASNLDTLGELLNSVEAALPCYCQTPYWQNTETVPVATLELYREYDRKREFDPVRREANYSPEGAERLGKYIDHLMEDIKKRGICEPLILGYYPYLGPAMLIEGNHRLVAAKKLGLKEVPVRGYISSRKDGWPIKEPKLLAKDNEYVPADLKPSQFMPDNSGIKPAGCPPATHWWQNGDPWFDFFGK